MNANELPPPVGVVIASHGGLARALLASTEMIVGAQEAVATVCLEPQDNLETFHAALSAAIDQTERGSGVLVLIDLFGGTPGHAAALCIRERERPIVSGVNLPMLLEVLLARWARSPEALSALALASGAKGIVDITAKIREAAAARFADD
ncbi:MAG TPA: PTS fructose transporter subunit IIA [Anaerolineae bacterium]|nr:PTS fructose transporter subunit IIA [Anaerolineae bacterium]